MQYNINVQEPNLSFIDNGKKTVEGRLNKGKFSRMLPGDTLTVDDLSTSYVIKAKRSYPSFKEMLRAEGISRVTPDKTNLEDAVSVYYQFFTKDQENSHGVVAIEFELIEQIQAV